MSRPAFLTFPPPPPGPVTLLWVADVLDAVAALEPSHTVTLRRQGRVLRAIQARDERVERERLEREARTPRKGVHA